MTLTLAPPQDGLKLMPLDYDKIVDLLRWCELQGIGYGMGNKAQEHPFGFRFDYPPIYQGGKVDCSGWAREAIYHATGGAVFMPDGSASQNDWCAAQDYKRSTYANCHLKDGYTRLAFCRHEDGESYGHVWLCRNGFTAESWGGHGPGSRLVGTPVLERIVSDVYVIA